MIKINTVVCNQLFVIHLLSIVVILSGPKPILESIILFERSLFRHLTETVAAVLSTKLASTSEISIPSGLLRVPRVKVNYVKVKKMFCFLSVRNVRTRNGSLLSSKANKWSYGVSCVSLFFASFFFNPTWIEKKKKIKKGNETTFWSPMFVSRKLNF